MNRSEAGWVLDEIETVSMLLGTLKIWKILHSKKNSIERSYTKKLPRFLLTSGLGLSQLKIRKKNDIDIKYNKLQNNIDKFSNHEYNPIDNGNISEDTDNFSLNRSYENNDNSNKENDINNSASILNKMKNCFIHKPTESINTIDMKSEDLLHINDIEMNSTLEGKRNIAANAAELRRKYPSTSSVHSMNSFGVKNPHPKPDRDDTFHRNGTKIPYPAISIDGLNNSFEDLEYIADDSEIHDMDESKYHPNIDIKISDEMNTNYDYDKLSNSIDGLSNNYDNISTSPTIGHVKIGSIMYGPINYLKNIMSTFTNTNESANIMNSTEAGNPVSTTDSAVELSRERSFKFNEQSTFKGEEKNIGKGSEGGEKRGRG
jgi:hypothetical protein